MTLITDFLNLINQLECCDSTLTGVCVLKNQEHLTLCQQLLDGEYEITFDGGLRLGELRFTYSPSTEVGYADYYDFFANSSWVNTELPLTKVLWHQWAKIHQIQDGYIDENNFSSVVLLVTQLKQALYAHQKIVVFFSKKPSELSLQPHDVKHFIELLRKINEEQRKAINELCNWLGNDIESGSFQAKKNAFSIAVTDFLTGKEGYIQHDISDLLEDIVSIKNQALAQYELYLEDFTYSKFVKKIEDNASKFIVRINDALGKSVNQVLALPIATAVFNLAKIDAHWVSILSLIVYATLCSFVLFIQQKNLFHIKDEIALFEENLPKQLKNKQWQLARQAIDQQICYQKKLTKFLWFVIFLAYVYAGYVVGYLLAL